MISSEAGVASVRIPLAALQDPFFTKLEPHPAHAQTRCLTQPPSHEMGMKAEKQQKRKQQQQQQQQASLDMSG